MNYARHTKKDLTALRKDSKKTLEALSYRESMRVSEIILFDGGYAFPTCPRCKTPLDREFMRFCDNCGQRLAWKKFSYRTAQIYSK